MQKARIMMIPAVLFFSLVFLPECLYKPARLSEERSSIEWRQITYTYFNILMSDTAGLKLQPEFKSRLMQYYQKSKLSNCYPMLGFSSDELMWGEAEKSVKVHFGGNEDTLNEFYKQMVLYLIREHPLAMTGHLLDQVAGFYLPGRVIKDKIWSNVDLKSAYMGSVEHAYGIDHDIGDHHLKVPYIGPLYPATFNTSGFRDFDRLPLFFGKDTLLYRQFDYLFFGCMVIFLLIRIVQRKLFEAHIVYLVHSMLFFYVIAVALVHTFDIDRFTHTIYPLLLLSVFLEAQYILGYLYEKFRTNVEA